MVIHANNKIMNNTRQLQCLQGKVSLQLHDDTFWSYLLFRLSNFPNVFTLRFRNEHRRRMNTSPSDMRRTTLPFTYQASIYESTTDIAFDSLRLIFGSNIGIGLRRKPPRIRDGSVPLHPTDLVNYVSQSMNSKIIMKYVTDLNSVTIEIKYATGSFHDRFVNSLLRNYMSFLDNH